jgi:hypothetical protein
VLRKARGSGSPEGGQHEAVEKLGRDPSAQFNDLTVAVAAWHQGPGKAGVVLPLDHQQVAVVQTGRVKADQHLTVSRLRDLDVVALQVLQAPLGHGPLEHANPVVRGPS